MSEKHPSRATGDPLLSAVILAGGESRRMGLDKAWVELDGQPLVTRALTTLRALGIGEVFISGRPGADFSSLHCPVLHDLEPGLGPLGGIERALRATTRPLVLVLAVDLGNMTPRFLSKLLGKCDRLTGAVPSLKGMLEPLAAIYPQRCHAIAAGLLAGSLLAARDFVAACLRERAVRLLPVSAADAACLGNINTPHELASARAIPCQKSMTRGPILVRQGA